MTRCCLQMSIAAVTRAANDDLQSQNRLLDQIDQLKVPCAAALKDQAMGSHSSCCTSREVATSEAGARLGWCGWPQRLDFFDDHHLLLFELLIICRSSRAHAHDLPSTTVTYQS